MFDVKGQEKNVDFDFNVVSSGLNWLIIGRFTPMSNLKPEKDFLRNEKFKKFIKSKWYPAIFHITVAIIFAFIVFELILGPDVAHDNFGAAATWVLWWPLLPILLLLFGRFWCIICPFGFLNDIVQKFVGSKKPVPKFLRKYGILYCYLLKMY